MARIRSVHPDICISETMATIPANLERTFVRLWTYCDDDGRSLDNPRLIKAAIYPLHDDMTFDTVDAELDELADRGLIVRYEVDGKRVIQVVSWSEYQHPQRPRPSDLPKPPEADTNDTRAVRDMYAKGTRQQQDMHVPGEGEGVGVGEGVGEGEGDNAAALRKEYLSARDAAAAAGIKYTDLEDAARRRVTRRKGVRNRNGLVKTILNDPEDVATLINELIAKQDAETTATQVAACPRCDTNGILLEEHNGRTVAIRCDHQEATDVQNG